MVNEAPRQLSANGEFGFPVAPCGKRVRVYVDGDLMRNCIAYDCDAGWIEVIVHDNHGKLVKHGDGWLSRRIKGDVRVALV